MFQIGFVGKEAFDLGALPARVGADELEEIAIGDGQHIQAEGFDGNFLGVRWRAKQRTKHAAGNATMPCGRIRRRTQSTARAESRTRRAAAGTGLESAVHGAYSKLLGGGGGDFLREFLRLPAVRRHRRCCPNCCGRRSARWRFARRSGSQGDHGAVVILAVDDDFAGAAHQHAANGVLLGALARKSDLASGGIWPGTPWPSGWWHTKQVCI